MRGIVTEIRATKFCPPDRIVFLRDIVSHPEANSFSDPDKVDGIICLIPPGKPALREAAEQLMGKWVDA